MEKIVIPMEVATGEKLVAPHTVVATATVTDTKEEYEICLNLQNGGLFAREVNGRGRWIGVSPADLVNALVKLAREDAKNGAGDRWE